MSESIDVIFEGKKMVIARMGDQDVITDLPPKEGGDGFAPTPFDLFLASLATCAGVYAQRFCDERGLSTEGLGLKVDYELNPDKFHVDRMNYTLTLPEGFPEKYEKAIVRAVDLCTVKKHLADPPEISVIVA